MADELKENMMEIPIDKFLDELEQDLIDEIYTPMIGLGGTGIGKTYSVGELAKRLGIGYREFRLANSEKADLTGLPRIGQQTGLDAKSYDVTTYVATELLPREGRDPEVGLLVLDEITSCASDVRAAALQLLDSRRSLGSYHLPDRWKVIALGNGMGDGGIYKGLEGAIKSRGGIYRISTNVSAWKKWALKSGVNNVVVAFLSFDPGRLIRIPDEDDASEPMYPTPRGWTNLSDVLNKREARLGKNLDRDMVEIVAARFVGASDAAAFAGFYSLKASAVSADDVLAGKFTAQEIRETRSEAMYITISAIVKRLNDEIGNADSFSDLSIDIKKKFVNAIKFARELKAYRADFAVALVSDLCYSNSAVNDMVIAGCDDDIDDMMPDFFDVLVSLGSVSLSH